jgi:hypothetical protein
MVILEEEGPFGETKGRREVAAIFTENGGDVKGASRIPRRLAGLACGLGRRLALMRGNK